MRPGLPATASGKSALITPTAAPMSVSFTQVAPWSWLAATWT